MRTETFHYVRSQTPAYVCYQCGFLYKDYSILVEHLYWKHGGEAQICEHCPIKMWPFAVHQCNVVPKVEDYYQIVTDEIDEDNAGKIINVDKSSTSASSPESDDDTVNDVIKHNDVVMKTSIEEDRNQNKTIRISEFCYCGMYLEGVHMIGCDGPSCTLQWFHYDCVGIRKPPAGSWYCNDCSNTTV